MNSQISSPAEGLSVVLPAPGSETRKGEHSHIGGSQSDTWNLRLANQVMNSAQVGHLEPGRQEAECAAILVAMSGIHPRDELEGMMVAQLVAAHNLAMDSYARALRPGHPMEWRKELLSQATKLSRTWATLLDALNKHRGKGQQKVTVEHVHVHAGGQAVVGTVETHRSEAPSASATTSPCPASAPSHPGAGDT